MKSLLKGLKPDQMSDEKRSGQSYESSEEDENVKKLISRKVSMNEQNVIGTNFEKYNDKKPSAEIRRKITNYISEYKENNDL